MFDKIKKIKELQASLSQEKVEVEGKGIKIVMNGKMEIEDIVLETNDPQEVKQCFNKAVRELQVKLAKKISF